MSIVAVVLARDDHYPLSAGLIVEICPTQWQCLCLRHILLRLGHFEGGSPWLHERRWPQATSPQKRGTVSLQFVFTHLCSPVVHRESCAKRTADINICGRNNGRSTAVMVCYSLFMVICLEFMLFRLSRDACARDARAHAHIFSCVFAQYNTNQTGYRDFTH